MPDRKRLTREDWAAAALTALGEGGLSAVAVEPIAARLGATKGSFYWHFRNRDALVEAALELWERRNTTDVITVAEQEPEPAAALHTLLSNVLTAVAASAHDPAAIESALQASARHPLIGPALERVSARRLEHLGVMFSELGFAPKEAARRAMIAFTAYLGMVQMARAMPSLLPDETGLRDHIDDLFAALTAPSGQGMNRSATGSGTIDPVEPNRDCHCG